MFEPVDIAPEYVLDILSIEKSLYDHLGIILGVGLGSDYPYDCMFDAIAEIAEDVQFAYNNDWEMNILHIVFPSMRQFYSLCREHSWRHRINFKRNPYVLEAAKVVDEHMRNIDNYDVGWRLCTPKKEYRKKYCELVVYTGMEFYQPAELVGSLCEIRDYYIEAEKRLWLELYGPKTKDTPAPVPIAPEGRAM